MKRRQTDSTKRIRRTGLYFMAFTLLALLASWNTADNMLYIITGGFMSFLVMSWGLCGWALRRLDVTREAPEAVHRGEELVIPLRVTNASRFLPAVSVRVESAAHPGASAGYAVKIPQRGTVMFQLKEVFDKRGVHRLPDIDLVTAFPFGLIESRRRFETRAEIVVYPRVSALRTGRLEQLGAGMPAARSSRGEGDEFFSLREYAIGDDIRHIAWRASARLGTLLVKEWELDRSRYVILALESQRCTHMADFEDRFEEAVDLIASLAVTLVNRQYKVAVVTSSTWVSFGEGQPHAMNVLDMLARLEISAPGPGGFTWPPPGETEHAAVMFVSPDPARWGAPSGVGRGRVIDPEEVVRA